MNLEEKRYFNIDFLRFFFAIGIVYFHILHSNIMGSVGNILLYTTLSKLSNNAGVIVECFFIIAGIFLHKSLEKSSDCSYVEYIYAKICRLWPVLAFSWLLEVMFFGCKPATAFINSFFLQCVGVTVDYKGINWFISPYFWAILFYAGVMKAVSKKVAMLVIAIIVYFSYVANIKYCNGGFGRETVYGLLNLGMMRALAGIGLGMLLCSLLEYLKKMSK